MRKHLAALGCLVSLFTLPAAASISVPASGEVVLQVVSLTADNTIQAIDVRGVAGLTFTEGSFSGLFILGDGTNLGFPAPAVPNTLLLATNAPSITEGLLLGLSNPRLGGPGFQVDANFVSLVSSGLTDPILLYLATFPTTLEFGFTSTQPLNDTQTLSQWSLVDVIGPTIPADAVPEPSTALLVAAGASCAFVFRRRM